MSGKVVVHIGTAKTGSSSLQRFLAINRKALNECGWDYPDLNHTFNSEIPYTSRWMNGGKTYLLNGDKKRFDSYLKEIDLIYEKYNVIISDEAIFGYGQSFVKSLQQRYRDISLVVYLRRQDTRIEAENAQLIKASIVDQNWVKEGYDVMPLNSYVDKLLKERCTRFFYSERLNEFVKIVGKSNLSVNTYEEAKNAGLYRHFISVLGLDYEGFESPQNCNLSLSVLDTEAKRRLNVFLREQSIPIYRAINDEYRRVIIRE